MSDYTPNQWANQLLARLRIKPTRANTRALVGWAQAEGGNWHNDARYNPLNTTQNMPGAGNTGTQGNIKQYKNWDQGLEATVKTLQNGRYGKILSALQGNDPLAVGQAIEASPWGTGGLALKTIPRAPGHPLSNIAASHASNVASTSTGVNPGASLAMPSASPSLLNVISNMNNSAASQGAPNVATGVGSTALSAQQDALRQAQSGTMSQLAQLSQPKSTSALASTASNMSAPSAAEQGGEVSGTGADAALSWAQSKIGFHETGKNSGGLASYLNGQFHMSGAPWCAMFTSAAVTKGGAPMEARSASVAEIRSKAGQGIGYEKGVRSGVGARPGDLILFGNDHIAMVQSVSDGKLHYVGGNQSDGVTEGSTSAKGAQVVRPLYGRR